MLQRWIDSKWNKGKEDQMKRQTMQTHIEDHSGLEGTSVNNQKLIFEVQQMPVQPIHTWKTNFAAAFQQV